MRADLLLGARRTLYYLEKEKQGGEQSDKILYGKRIIGTYMEIDCHLVML
jgi:hypothetical protein